MPCTIVDTPGASDATSYIDVTDATTYFAARLYTETWDDADPEDQCKALKMATRMLDQNYEWNGTTVNSDQALLWPRTGVTGPNGYLEPSDAIPTRIAQATAELAMSLLAADRTAESEEAAKGISQVVAGSVSVSFRGGAPISRPIPDVVAQMVAIYGIKKSGGAGAVTLRRA